LTYIVATVKPLAEYRQGPEISEFSELFEHCTYYLGMLDERDALQMVDAFAQTEGLALTPDDRAFILAQAGGHPGLIEAVCYAFASALERDELRAADGRDYRLLRKRLEDDARIEKLVSHQRQKIEVDPANPRYLITVRGRGYRLLSSPAH
jgi:hypothetical protein